MTTTTSTTVKVIVSMVVVAALVATTFNSKVRTVDRGLAIVLCLHRQTTLMKPDESSCVQLSNMLLI
jgi:hypothetical protein